MGRILVTGGSGMVGRYLKELLPTAHYPTSKELDLLDFENTLSYIHTLKPTAVIHLAAVVGGIKDNIQRPVVYFEDNVLMNFNIVKACHEARVQNFITTLSTCAYPDILDQYPIQEEDIHYGPPAQSNYGYGYAKRLLGAHIDVLTSANKELKYCYLIPCNLFGEYDKYEDTSSHFVSALLKKIIVAKRENKSYIELLGTGKPLRQFMYAKDLARLIVEMLETGTYKNMNVATDNTLSINQLALETLKALNLEYMQIKYSGDLDGQYRKDASNEKMLSSFPEFKLTPYPEAIRHTYKYLVVNNIF